MQYRKLGDTGLEVSTLSYGASSLGSVFREINEEEGIRAVHKAVELGINYIDVSPYYGLTKAETVLGKAIMNIPRDKFILSTKAGRYGENEFDFSYARIMNSVEESMARLHTDYIDMLLLHDIEFGDFNQIITEAIPALQKLKEQGKIRFYGVSGLPLSVFERMLKHVDLDVILSYCHYSLNDTSLSHLLPLLTKRKVGLINASPISMGLLSNRPVPDWHPAGEEIKQACKKAAEFCRSQGEDISKLAIQYSIADQRIPTTLVSTASVENVEKNIRWAAEPINSSLLKEVLRILEPVHNQSWAINQESKEGNNFENNRL
ncbi:aldo/keto reductase [Aquibacillus halophilus]|uniref:Aldo/keto reductase n=1 Tax=Aquibacillus halophilus TaxID=930132 RepID=A0A6A8D5S7_9BACI|nr:aldo/keto reductase [Aquibacillus halophilus]MRH41063.1 aldo/keto reductase [Aquibacillus halophilus]